MTLELSKRKVADLI